MSFPDIRLQDTEIWKNIWMSFPGFATKSTCVNLCDAPELKFRKKMDEFSSETASCDDFCENFLTPNQTHEFNKKCIFFQG